MGRGARRRRGVLVTFLVFSFFDVHAAEVPRTVWVIDALLTLALVAGSRMLARTIIERPQSRSIVARGKEVIVVGAGDAAQLMLKEMLRTPDLGYTPIGLIDDDPRKKNLRLHGIRVLGTSDELPHLLRDRRPDELLIAIPSASGEQRAADRRDRARRERDREDAAGPERADRRRPRPRQARSGRSRSRTCSAASRSRSTSTRSPPT